MASSWPTPDHQGRFKVNYYLSMQKKEENITVIQFNVLNELYRFYNRELFSGELPECLINLSRKNGAAGFFSPASWVKGNKHTGMQIHEISINPDHILSDDMEWHQTLVHEMCHLWQQEFGSPSRKCYHDKQWADKMELCGLTPSSTHRPGGKRTGQRMGDYPTPGGVFLDAYAEACKIFSLPYKQRSALAKEAYYLHAGTDTGNVVMLPALPANGKQGVKATYVCGCGNKVWGRPELNIVCGSCSTSFERIK